ncbi:TEA/ATTS domain family-domain-containing protein [Butyriboletus roseoflavus]|nr:TEA/ATTS domain family-domain-containing protein [Butyriboletus roseoflavus]
MESPEVDIKPAVPTDDIPDKSLLTDPGTGKLKQSRYEDVWPEDVHAAFMEAVALYPPMGKRRLKYYRVSMHENEHLSDGNRSKSFGRCQLIQSYILEKTGKNRSRKQVSSHLQRLKKIHKDNPAMRPLFSERSQPPSEHFSAPQAISSQDIFANISFSTRHLKSDFGLTVSLQNADTSADTSSMFSCASEASSLNGGSCNALDLSTDFHNQPPFFFPQEFHSPQQCPAGTLHPFDSDYFSELQDPLLFKDAMNGGFRAGSAFNTSAFSISMRRLASKLPIQGRQVESGSTTHFSRPVHSPGIQSTHQWVSQDDLMNGISCNSPLPPAQQAFHIPFHPLQLIPPDKQRLEVDPASDWVWPQNPDIPLGPREGTLGEVRLRYPPAMYADFNSTCPEMRVNSPGSHNSPSESEVPRLPRGISYSYAVTSPATMSESVSNESTINFPGHAVPESFENLTSPLVIKPTPVYPISYIYPNIHFDGRTPAPSLPP